MKTPRLKRVKGLAIEFIKWDSLKSGDIVVGKIFKGADSQLCIVVTYSNIEHKGKHIAEGTVVILPCNTEIRGIEDTYWDLFKKDPRIEVHITYVGKANRWQGLEFHTVVPEFVIDGDYYEDRLYCYRHIKKKFNHYLPMELDRGEAKKLGLRRMVYSDLRKPAY